MNLDVMTPTGNFILNLQPEHKNTISLRSGRHYAAISLLKTIPMRNPESFYLDMETETAAASFQEELLRENEYLNDFNSC
jgi:hypothetical protein